MKSRLKLSLDDISPTLWEYAPDVIDTAHQRYFVDGTLSREEASQQAVSALFKRISVLIVLDEIPIKP